MTKKKFLFKKNFRWDSWVTFYRFKLKNISWRDVSSTELENNNVKCPVQVAWTVEKAPSVGAFPGAWSFKRALTLRGGNKSRRGISTIKENAIVLYPYICNERERKEKKSVKEYDFSAVTSSHVLRHLFSNSARMPKVY